MPKSRNRKNHKRKTQIYKDRKKQEQEKLKKLMYEKYIKAQEDYLSSQEEHKAVEETEEKIEVDVDLPEIDVNEVDVDTQVDIDINDIKID